MATKKFPEFPVLKTKRFILRQLLPTDAPQIFKLRSNEEVNKYIDRDPSKTIEDAEAFIQSIQNRDLFYWAVTAIGIDELIGTVCMFNFSDDGLQGEIGYELIPDFQKKGIMREIIPALLEFGFDQLGLQLIEGEVHPQNLASIKLLESMGFKKAEADSNGFLAFQLKSSG